MKYCVIKDTTKVIDGSENSIEIMLQNVQNAGFSETEVEILAPEEYQARKDLEPVQPQLISIEERLKTAEDTILGLMDFIMMGGM
jgi:hypothetical protein